MRSTLHDLNADLHAHSTTSDGTLAPCALVARAKGSGVSLFALTDHDVVDGVAEARAAAVAHDLRFVAGVEISVTWAGQTVHVVGLGIDPDCPGLRAFLEQTRSGRTRRANEMAAALAAIGVDGALEGALAYAGNPELISRTHFARYLVERGVCADTREVFRRFLVEGKPGYVAHRWADLADALGWIRAAGGVAVLAHPGRYKYAETAMHELLAAFRDGGGAAIEVATSNHSAAEVRQFAQLAAQYGLEASRGSDFHAPGEAEVDLGRVHAVPRALKPVWHRFV
jgi:predicted metal-dependent phosphoesterase TrpH